MELSIEMTAITPVNFDLLILGTLLQTFSKHANDVMDVAYSHDGKWIATASADKTVELWEVNK